MLWKPGMPLPELPKDYTPWLTGQEQPLIIVENPVTYDQQGNTVENVSVAQPFMQQTGYHSVNSTEKEAPG